MEKLSLSLEAISLIENVMSVFFETTGIPCCLIDAHGTEVLMSRKKTDYCTYFKHSDSNVHVCNESHQSSSRQSELIGETYISFCPSGLVHFTKAIHIGGKYAAAIVAGPVLFDIPDIYLFRKLMEDKSMAIPNMAILEMYYTQVNMVDVEKGRRLRELMDIVVRDIQASLKALNASESEDEIEIDDLTPVNHGDDLVEVKLTSEEKYPVHLEKELSHYIRHSNKLGVRKTLNEILGFIYLRCEADYREIMMMVLQVVVLMSRAGADIGISYSEVSVYVSDFVGKINEENSSEGAYEHVSLLLDQVMATLFPEATKGNNDKIVTQKVTSYIQNNYNTGLTLEEVASYVNMNPTYLSRFIKKQLGSNFSDYVNNIRVEYSKEYLENGSYSIIDIALMMGFTDQSYYSKVFKKYAGMTPGKYRRMVKQVPDA